MKIENPKVSVIVPNYNHAPYLRQRIDSILQQSYQHFEIILLDDASTDDSVSIIRSYQNHKNITHCVINSQNSGSAFAQWKKGIELAKGEWIWIAESDDFADSRFLSSLLEWSEQFPECGLVFCQSYEVDSTGQMKKSLITYTEDIPDQPFQSDFHLLGTDFIQRGLKYKNVIPNASAVLCKKSFLLHALNHPKIGQMRMAGDWLVWLRVCSKTSIAFLAAPLNSFRNHDSTTRKHNTIEKRKRRLWEEKWVRDEMTRLPISIDQTQQIERLHAQWFDFHSGRNLLRAEFWRFKIRSYPLLRYVLRFFRYNQKYR